MHACEYRTGKGMEGKAVLVVGSGNSGMEIAYDLAEAGAATSIIVRSEIHTPAYPVVDVGTYAKIKTGEIQVLPAMKAVHGNVVEFADGKRHPFDAIVFATGYRSTTKKWLKSDDGLIGEDGMARRSFPEHWKGENGLYCAGMVRRGLYGSCEDAESIAEDISKKKKKPHQA
ncbi:unnamed protein product [Triticum turgidum subsp. durum]|uniref:indole-3-pyruvate monooxygenase n=1 Tax=Triticum turgidum subsp. durum TaxID=4567 RepID=A0A9R0TRS9_TRITD|nr:unnamed protein product [Triticum turgidum subsp. durum]